MSALVLAIDGPSGSGKSSTAKAIALRANWSYLDTGALYRAVTYLALENKVDSEEKVVALLEKVILPSIQTQQIQRLWLMASISLSRFDFSE